MTSDEYAFDAVMGLALAGRGPMAVARCTGLSPARVDDAYADLMTDPDTRAEILDAQARRVFELEARGFDQARIALRIGIPEKRVQSVLLAALSEGAA